MGLSAGALAADANAQGAIASRPVGDSEVSQQIRFDAAALLSDRWQAGFTLPIVRRSRDIVGNASESAGIGDLSLTLAYEALPEWSYSPWRPKGFVFLQGRLPTGRSRFDSGAALMMDARGRGFFGLGGGVVLLNHWGAWDAILLAEGHRYFSRNFTDSATGTDIHHEPGWGASASLGIGVSPGRGPLRLGIAISPSVDAGVSIRGALNFDTPSESSWTATLQASYLFSPEWSLTAAYSDQVLLGGARNAGLSRTFLVSLQKRWQR